MTSQAIETEEAISRLRVMRYQETSIYGIDDYLQSSTTRMCDVNADCRTKMAKWCYHVIDFCKFRRETAQISMSYLDRYLATDEGSIALYDTSLFQLASMTALYTAVKIHEPEAMDPKLVSDLSRGLYSINEIEEMERDMLTAIDWRVNPPTSMSFCREFMNLIPEEILDDLVRKKVFALTQAQIEEAVCEYKFITVTASTLAFCSLINSIERLVNDDYVTSIISSILSESVGTGYSNVEVDTITAHLRLYQASIAGCSQNSRRTAVISKEPKREVTRTNSPRCITGL